MIKDVVNVILLSIIVILTFYYYCVLFFKKININWPGRIIIIVFFLIIIINFKNMLDWFHYFFICSHKRHEKRNGIFNFNLQITEIKWLLNTTVIY